VLNAHEREITQQRAKMAFPEGLRPKCGQPTLLVVHLDSPNFPPRALAGLIWDTALQSDLM